MVATVQRLSAAPTRGLGLLPLGRHRQLEHRRRSWRRSAARARQSFSIGFAEEGYDELGFARWRPRPAAPSPTFAQRVATSEAQSLVARVIDAYDQPFGNASAIPTLAVRRSGASARGVHMLLARRRRRRDLRRQRALRQGSASWRPGTACPRRSRRSGAPSAASAGAQRQSLPQPRRELLRARVAAQPRSLLHRRLVRVRSLRRAADAGVPARRARATPRSSSCAASTGSGASGGPLHRMMRLDLHDGDRAERPAQGRRRGARRAGVSVRFPYLDPALVAYMSRLPERYKVRGLKKRYLFKRAMQGHPARGDPAQEEAGLRAARSPSGCARIAPFQSDGARDAVRRARARARLVASRRSSRGCSPSTSAARWDYSDCICAACSCSSCGCGDTSMRREAVRPTPERPLRILMVLESELHASAAAAAPSRRCARSRAHLTRRGQRVAVMTPLFARRAADRRRSAATGIAGGAPDVSALPIVGGGAHVPALRRVPAADTAAATTRGTCTSRTTWAPWPARSARSSASRWSSRSRAGGSSRRGCWRPIAGSLDADRARLAQARRGRAGDQHAHRGASSSGRASRPSASSCCRTPSTPRASPRGAAPRAAGRAVHGGLRGAPRAREGAGDAARRPGRARSPGARTCACGSSAAAPLEEELRAQAERARHRRRRSSSSATSDRVEEVLAEADVGVLPSRIEGLSNTLLEFMASGLPAIASRVSGSEDFVVHGPQRLALPRRRRRGARGGLREAAALPAARAAGARARSARADVEAAAALDDASSGGCCALYRGTPPRELREGSASHVRHRRHRRRARRPRSRRRRSAHAMNAAITHRGPDDEGLFRDEQAMLGMRRLSIIDLAGGHQPMHNEDGTIQCRLQRRDLQLPRAARRARGARPPLLHAAPTPRSSSTATRSGARAASRASTACSASRCGTRARARSCSRAIASARSRSSTRTTHARAPRSSPASSSRCCSVPGFRREIDARGGARLRLLRLRADAGQHLRGRAQAAAGPLPALRRRPARACTATTARARAQAPAQRGATPRRSWRACSTRPSRAGSSPTCRSARSCSAGSTRASSSRSCRATSAQPVRTFSIGFREAEYNELSDARRVVAAPRHRAPRARRRARRGRAPAAAGLVPRRAVRRLVGGADLPRREARARARQDGAHRRRAATRRSPATTATCATSTCSALGALKPAAAATAAARRPPRARRARLSPAPHRRAPAPALPRQLPLAASPLTRADVADELLGDAVRPRRADHYGGLAAVARAAERARGARPLRRHRLRELPARRHPRQARSHGHGQLARGPRAASSITASSSSRVRLPRELRVQGRRGKHLLRKVAARWLPRRRARASRSRASASRSAKWFRGPLARPGGRHPRQPAFRERGLIAPGGRAALPQGPPRRRGRLRRAARGSSCRSSCGRGATSTRKRAGAGRRRAEGAPLLHSCSTSSTSSTSRGRPASPASRPTNIIFVLILLGDARQARAARRRARRGCCASRCSSSSRR